MPTRGATDADPADDFAFEFNRQAPTKDQNLVIHIPQGLDIGNFGEEFSQVQRGTS